MQAGALAGALAGSFAGALVGDSIRAPVGATILLVHHSVTVSASVGLAVLALGRSRTLGGSWL